MPNGFTPWRLHIRVIVLTSGALTGFLKKRVEGLERNGFIDYPTAKQALR